MNPRPDSLPAPQVLRLRAKDQLSSQAQIWKGRPGASDASGARQVNKKSSASFVILNRGQTFSEDERLPAQSRCFACGHGREKSLVSWLIIKIFLRSFAIRLTRLK